MMLKFFVALLLIVEGLTESDICERPPLCSNDDIPKKFPETEDELKKFCKPFVEYTKCIFEFEEKCREPEPEEIQMAYRIIAIMEEICSEDTLLHAAVVDNLKCLSRLIDDDTKFCPINGDSEERMRQYAETLSEEGLVTLAENEGDEYTLQECLNMMNFFACQSVMLERECGAVAMEAWVDIIQQIGPGVVLGCENPYELLPAVIRLHKLEEEKERSIAEVFRRRK